MRLHQVTPDRLVQVSDPWPPGPSHAHRRNAVLHCSAVGAWTGGSRSSPVLLDTRATRAGTVDSRLPANPLLSRSLAVGSTCWVGSRSRGCPRRDPCGPNATEQPGGGVQWRIASHCAPSVVARARAPPRRALTGCCRARAAQMSSATPERTGLNGQRDSRWAIQAAVTIKRYLGGRDAFDFGMGFLLRPGGALLGGLPARLCTRDHETRTLIWISTRVSAASSAYSLHPVVQDSWQPVQQRCLRWRARAVRRHRAALPAGAVHRPARARAGLSRSRRAGGFLLDSLLVGRVLM